MQLFSDRSSFLGDVPTLLSSVAPPPHSKQWHTGLVETVICPRVHVQPGLDCGEMVNGVSVCVS